MRPLRWLTSLALLAGSGAGAAIVVEPWPLPVETGAAQPGLVDDAGGGWLLSWIEPIAHGHRLRYARWSAPGWSSAATAMQGSGWFVNWADVPAMLAFPDGGLAAFMLVRNGTGPYAYDVQLALGDAQGRWREPRAVHDDRTATEHGFASLWREGDDTLGIAWLDGRQTSGGGHAPLHGSGDAGAMSLRAAMFGRDGDKQMEWPLDARTCDCCGTAVARSSSGLWLAYRGRDVDEVRDIRVAHRANDGHWQPAVVAHADRWVMRACPVNGPALAASGARVYLAWHTAPDRPRVRLARLGSDGRARTAPLEIAQDSVTGRVALAAEGEQVWLAWFDEADAQARLWLACLDPDLHELSRAVVALLPRGRGSGFPRLQARDGRAYLVATDVVAGAPRLRGWTASCAP